MLKRWIPDRIFAPGTTPAYSNYATSLAGYIVERVSGEPFDDYVEHHIFAPLGMRNSTLPPAAAGATAADAWRTAIARPRASRCRSRSSARRPPAALSATGADMARFMIAHLNNGELDGLLHPRRDRAA